MVSSRYRILAGVVALGCTRSTSVMTAASSPGCNAPARDAVVTVDAPGNPFQALPSLDGCWVYVSITRGANASSGIALYKRSLGALVFVRERPIAGSPAGMALTSDGKLPVVADNDRVAFIDTDRLVAGRSDAVVGYLVDSGAKGRVYANVTADDKYALIADENTATVSVIDLDKARATRFAVTSTVGRIPTGAAPIALTFSPMESSSSSRASGLRRTTGGRPSASARGTLGRTTSCRWSTQGVVHVVDVDRAKVDPPHAIIANAPAGCSPVRLALSPDGERAYVTARNSNSLMVFDTRKLRADPQHALVGQVPVGSAPVGVAVSVNGGRQVIVTNSNRFAGSANDSQSLTIVDATKVAAGASAVVGSIPAGAFPRGVAGDGGWANTVSH